MEQLTSHSPNERAKAINWLKQHPHEITSSDLMKAMQAETIPRLQLGLNQALKARQTNSFMDGASSPKSTLVEDPGEITLPKTPELDLAGLVRHELSPAVGWIRLAADGEISNFDESATNHAVKKLQRRIDGLIALIKQTHPLNYTRTSLDSALIESWPDPQTRPATAPDSGAENLEIETDISLFHLVLANAYQNAIDASMEHDGKVNVTVAWGVESHRFWIRITNPFAGHKFEFEDVFLEGHSSKAAHQGKGVALMNMAAKRLGYTFQVRGQSGHATTIIGGKIAHD